MSQSNISTGLTFDSEPIRQTFRVGDFALNKEVTIPKIMNMTAEKAGLHASQLLEIDRRREIARPRQVAMYLCRKHLPKSLPTIGQRFGMDHTTILYGCRKIQSILDDVTHKECCFVSDLINRVEVDLGLAGKSAVVHWVHPRNKRGEI
jgi:chromosomal replication initiation ATPase DnaA